MINNKIIIVGLGNPGLIYDKSRHNTGFNFIDILIKSNVITKRFLKFESLIYESYIQNRSVLLVKPQTYMNCSGRAVKSIMDYYNLPLSNLIVISDDISLKAGAIRIKRNGSAGGHNGLKSIIESLNTSDFARIKIGVGYPESGDNDIISWVLGTPSKEDFSAINNAVLQANDIIENLLLYDLDFVMNKYNNYGKNN